MNTDYKDKHLLDITDKQEPVYDKPIELLCYEKWSEGLQPSIDKLDEMGDEYENRRPF
jgi:hypothetical protein